MTDSDLERQLAEARKAIHDLQQELDKTNSGLIALNLELEQRHAQLQALNEELASFSYSVSHDLRAPLRSIDGFSQIVLTDYLDKLDERGQDYLRRICAATQHMGLLIDGLLGLSRVTRSQMRYETVDLTELARSLVADLRKREPDRVVHFAAADGITVRGDPTLLRAALENLLGNAWKFTGKQPVAAIEFGLTEHQAKSTYFVRDNGTGFDMTYAGKLFAPFQRLHSPREFPGTGIGLATVKRIIDRHGGRVWGEGAVDKGATFYFTLGGKEKTGV